MSDQAQLQRVTVVDFNMSFWRLVIFMVKAALAAIPAMIILAAICALSLLMFRAIVVQALTPTVHSETRQSPAAAAAPRVQTAEERAAVDVSNAAIARTQQNIVASFDKDPIATKSRIRSMLAAKDYLSAYQLAAKLSAAHPDENDLNELKLSAYNGLLGR